MRVAAIEMSKCIYKQKRYALPKIRPTKMMMRCENDNDAMFLRCGGSECSDDMSINVSTLEDYCSRNYMPKNIVHDPNHFGHGKFSLGLKDDRD